MNTFYLVWTRTGHAPTMQHKTYNEAINEATRLCSKHPNQEFFVLKATDSLEGTVGVRRSSLMESL